MHTRLVLVGAVLSAAVCLTGFAAEKVELGEPEDKNLAEELKKLPDGVLKVNTNADGSFQSLVVKATVEIEDVLGGDKGKRLARKEAEIQCKKHLAQWLKEHCVFVETSAKTVTIITKGESTEDAAGNTVKIRTQQGQEVKVLSEAHASLSEACLKGLIVLSSEVTAGASPEYVLVMGLSQKTLAQAAAVRDALRGSGVGAFSGQPVTGRSDNDKPTPEQKVNPEAKDFR